jgi:hypothetical protein
LPNSLPTSKLFFPGEQTLFHLPNNGTPHSWLVYQDKGDRGRRRPESILLIVVDGMHAIDLANYVSTHPDSTLTELARHGITYDNDSTSTPSDSFPGLAASTPT